jgi:RND family efflux transporter MFP subunit
MQSREEADGHAIQKLLRTDSENLMRECSRIRWLLAMAVCLSLAGCARSSADTHPPEPALPEVIVSHPLEREVTDYADFTGRTEAVDAVEVRARVDGYLEKVNFKEGALVKQGDVLFEIDPRPYQAEVDRAQAQVATHEATLKRAQADNARARILSIKSPGVLAQQEVDRYRAEEEEALANLHASKAALVNAQLNLGFTKVTSAIDGRVSRYSVTVGNLIVHDQTLLTTIVSVDPIYVYFDVDENTVLRVRQLIRAGKARSARDSEVPVKLGLANEEAHPHLGTINFVDNKLNPRTGTLRLRGVFANPDEQLAPGYFARVRVPIGQPYQALLVSERALDSDQGQRIVYVVDDKNKLIARPVRIGALHDGRRVIEDGLQPGEQVVVIGLQHVRPGLSVEPKLITMPGAAPRKGDTIRSLVRN